jgi:hypothetical protein
VDPTINVGKMVTSGWIGSKAPKGLVEIVGYNDSVLVERGAAQSTTAAAITRAATINYWNGTAYTPLSVISTTPDTTRTTGVVTYADANVTLTASATVSVSAPIAKTSGANCAVDRCRVQGDAGLISVTLKIVVVPASGTPYLLETVLLINGSTAYAQFTEPVDV